MFSTNVKTMLLWHSPHPHPPGDSSKIQWDASAKYKIWGIGSVRYSLVKSAWLTVRGTPRSTLYCIGNCWAQYNRTSIILSQLSMLTYRDPKQGRFLRPWFVRLILTSPGPLRFRTYLGQSAHIKWNYILSTKPVIPCRAVCLLVEGYKTYGLVRFKPFKGFFQLYCSK